VRKRRYAIIGTGAVGGFYGARLARAGLDVHFLLRSDFEHVRAHGLVVESPDGDFALPRVQAYARAADLPAADVTVLAVKTTENGRLAELLPASLVGEGAVLVLQNGLGNEDEVAAAVGHGRVTGGLCFLCSNKAGPGRIQHLDYGFVTLADYAADGRPPGVTDRMREIAADFQAAGIPTEFADDLVLARWRKLVWNVPFSGLSVVLDATSAELMADPAARRLAEDLMRDVADGARACGKAIEEGFLRHMLGLTEKMTPYRTSMKIDYDLGRPMEVEAIFGRPVRAAREAGAACPRMAALYALLGFLDARNRARRGA